MAQATREIFVVGLRNAHAMEVQAPELMERQSERLTDIQRYSNGSRRICGKPNSS